MTDMKIPGMEMIGGFADVTLEQTDPETTSIMIGEYRFLDLYPRPDGMVAIHKRPHRKPVIVDAKELMIALINILT